MLDLAVMLREHGHAPVLVFPGTDAALALRKRARGAGIPNFSLYGEGGEVDQVRLAGFLTAAKVDVFHCHAGIAWEGHQCVRTAHWAGVPAVVRTEHLPWQTRDREDGKRYVEMSRLVDFPRDTTGNFSQYATPRFRSCDRRTRRATTPPFEDL